MPSFKPGSSHLAKLSITPSGIAGVIPGYVAGSTVRCKVGIAVGLGGVPVWSVDFPVIDGQTASGLTVAVTMPPLGSGSPLPVLIDVYLLNPNSGQWVLAGLYQASEPVTVPPQPAALLDPCYQYVWSDADSRWTLSYTCYSD